MRAADRLEAVAAADLTLAAHGAFAADLPRDLEDNLVLRVARALRDRYGVVAGARLRLRKDLPVAAGLGGGSADAAAALRLLARLWDLPAGDGELARLGARFGADIPACVHGRPALVSGIGEVVEAQPALPACGLVLAGPGVPVSTAEAFAARTGGWSAPVAWTPPGCVDGLVSGLAGLGNDLAPAALSLAPAIADVMAALEALPHSLLVRLSGSGGSCFAVFRDPAQASAAADALGAARPDWWVAATELVSERPAVAAG